MPIQLKEKASGLFKWEYPIVIAVMFFCLSCTAEEGLEPPRNLLPNLFVSSFRLNSYAIKNLVGGSTSTKSKPSSKEKIFFYREINQDTEIDNRRNVAPIFSKKFEVDEVSSDRNKQRDKGSSNSRLLSSVSGSIPNQPSLLQRLVSQFKHLKISPSVTPRKDVAIFLSYAFAIVVNTIPTICLPLMAADLAATVGPSLSGTVPSSGTFSANILSFATLGGALGKFINGFVCKRFGGRASARSYFLFSCVLSMLLSNTSNSHGILIAGLEFSQSIMWTACTVLLINLYETDPQKLAASITTLSLTSSGFILMTKIFGVGVLEFVHWRTLAKVGSVLALSGAAVAHFLIDDTSFAPGDKTIHQTRPRFIIERLRSKQDGESNLLSSLKSILGNKLFWLAGLSHATVHLVRGMDKILGSFYQEASGLQAHIGSGMTSSVTIGFVYGLISSKEMQSFKNAKVKEKFLGLRYKKALIASLFLICCGHKSLSTFVGNFMTALLIALASSTIAANVSYQFYTIPALVAKQFGANRAVCLSFLDAVAFLISAPVWIIFGKVISWQKIGSHGWSAAWGVFAAMLFTGGCLWSNIAPSVLED